MAERRYFGTTAGQIYDAFRDQFQTGSLIVRSKRRNDTDPTGRGIISETTSRIGDLFFEDETEERFGTTFNKDFDAIISIFASSVSGTVRPQPDHIIQIDENEQRTEYTITEVKPDPLHAVWTCAVNFNAQFPIPTTTLRGSFDASFDASFDKG